jgi:hypothetical protein
MAWIQESRFVYMMEALSDDTGAHYLILYNYGSMENFQEIKWIKKKFSW